jgi:hypothetical protein
MVLGFVSFSFWGNNLKGIVLSNNDLNFASLSSNAICLVIISSVFYLYKDTLINIIPETDLTSLIQEIVKQISKKDDDVNVKDFIDKSKEDYQSISKHNRTTRIMHRNTYFIELGLVFFSTALCLLDYYWNATSTTWKSCRFFYIIEFNFVLFVTMTYHSIIVGLQYWLKHTVISSAERQNMEKMWHAYRKEIAEMGEGKVVELSNELRNRLEQDGQ